MKRVILLAALALSGAAFAAGASKKPQRFYYINQYHTKGIVNQRGQGHKSGSGYRSRGPQQHSRYRTSSKGRVYAGALKSSRSGAARGNSGARAKRK